MMAPLHLITCEYPPTAGGVSEHSRVLAESAVAAGYDVHVWTAVQGPATRGITVHAALGDFSGASLARADAALDAWPAPRRVIVQWVPHGYGRRGMNIAFARWIRRRARGGDSIDLVVHEAFADVFGGSWRQPALAAVQRYMTRTTVRAAERVWLTIPAWEPRIRGALRAAQPAPRILPVPGTIPLVSDAAAVASLRTSLLGGRTRLVGYFGGGDRYALDAIAAAMRDLTSPSGGPALVCIGRGSDEAAAAIRASAPASAASVSGTGMMPLDRVSLHLQACDALLQPYPDGVSGRRTTTVSALEHGIPVATTLGALSEPFWAATRAVETAAAADPRALRGALTALLDPPRNSEARSAALALYGERFDPARTLNALFAAPEAPVAASADVALPIPGTRVVSPR